MPELVGQRYQLGQRVKKVSFTSSNIPKRYISGKIIEVFTKQNSLGFKHQYYRVQWDDKRTSEHAQHTLKPLT
tara:strand:+ start:422 stop:640 length:219 start_codon:yes stop_codon:yes gene_type:complete